MKTLEATFRIVTPMFLGGADPENLAELRPPSIKGLLRFWWRTLMYSEFDGNIEKLSSHEARIFGGSGNKQGQACFLIRVIDFENISFGNKGDERWNKNPIAYLGFGPIIRDPGKKKHITIRPFIFRGRFKIQLLFKPLPSNPSHESQVNHEKDITSVKKALWAMVMFGGFGSRSRNGFGSIVVESVEGMDELPKLIVQNREELIQELNKFIALITTSPKLPEYTAWSDTSRCIVFGFRDSGEKALEWLGGKIQSMRSWRGAKRMDWAAKDHDMIKDYVDCSIVPGSAPNRTVFGLPHNYFFSRTFLKAEVNLMNADKKGRRASPLFFKVHEFQNPLSACVIATFLPAQLTPPNTYVTLTSEGKKTVSLPLPNNFDPIEDVLDALLKENGKEVSK